MKVESLTEVKTKAGDTMLKAMFECLRGDDKGRKIFENYLLTHKNPKAVEMNFKKLRELAAATGIEKEYTDIAEVAADAEEFLQIPINVTIDIREPYTSADGRTRIDNNVVSVAAR